MVPRRLIAAAALAAASPALAAPPLDSLVGKKLFERHWVQAPSSTKSDDGLGPIYDAPSCSACHGGTGTIGGRNGFAPGTVIRLGNASGAGDPVYGTQLQTRALPGIAPEADPKIAWSDRGALRIATIVPEHLGYGPLASSTRLALRRAPPLSGASLLAEVPESEILKRADPGDHNEDGIAGRPAWVTDGQGRRALGRFGWKASEPDLASQIQAAFSRDIGLSTPGRPEPWGECTPAQAQCRKAPHGAGPGEVEVDGTLVDLIASYLDRLQPEAIVQDPRGKAVFDRIGCAECHATLHLADGHPVPAYTDLLLHSMGAALNDGIKEGAAAPGEWRTAPLWTVKESLKEGGLLHDGRARTVTDAIEWHGGEGSQARARFRALSSEDKAALVAFVGAL